MFPLIFKYFWLFGIAAGVFNYFWQKQAVRKYIAEDPEREPGYERLLQALLLITVSPFAVMGAAIIAGELPDLTAFLNPRGEHWLVRALWIFFSVFWMAVLGWMILGEGAAFLEKHPGIVRIKFPGVDRDRPTARQIRLSAIFFAAIFLFLMTMLWVVGDGAFTGKELPLVPPR